MKDLLRKRERDRDTIGSSEMLPGQLDSHTHTSTYTLKLINAHIYKHIKTHRQTPNIPTQRRNKGRQQILKYNISHNTSLHNGVKRVTSS